MGKKSKKKNFKEDKTMENNVEERNVEEVVEQTTPEVVETTQEVVEMENQIVETPIENQESVEEVSEENKTEENEDVVPEVTEKTNENESENQSEETNEVEPVLGSITCSKLHVRAEASKESASLGIIDNTVGLIIDTENSTEDFYKVTTSNGIEGYCVKDFVKID